MEDQKSERRRPPNWVTRFKDPGIILIVLGLCVTTGKQIERMDDMDKRGTEMAQINTQLTSTVTQLAVQVTNLSSLVASVPEVTKSATKLEARMDESEKSNKEFREDLKGWMVRVETKIDQRDRR